MQKYSEKQLNNLRVAGKILRKLFVYLEDKIKAGISTLDIDKLAEDFITNNGGEPVLKNYHGYGHTICASVNEECIHGKPRPDKILCDGDIVSIDCDVRYRGMCVDATRIYTIGEISDEAKELIKTAKDAFYFAIDGLKAGDRVSSIGKKIEKFINKRYGIIETYFGHGIGKNVHEEPLIPNFDIDRTDVNPRIKQIANTILYEGSVICIEPMINLGTKDVVLQKDGWTVATADGKISAHYENTLIITENGVEIVT